MGYDTLYIRILTRATGGDVGSGWLHAASRLARISLTIPDGVTDLACGVPVLLPGVVVVVVGLAKDAFSKRARVAANVGSFFTLSAEPASTLCNIEIVINVTSASRYTELTSVWLVIT